MIVLNSDGLLASTTMPFVPPTPKTSSRNKPAMTPEKAAMHDRGLEKIYAVLDRFKP